MSIKSDYDAAATDYEAAAKDGSAAAKEFKAASDDYEAAANRSKTFRYLLIGGLLLWALLERSR